LQRLLGGISFPRSAWERTGSTLCVVPHPNGFLPRFPNQPPQPQLFSKFRAKPPFFRPVFRRKRNWYIGGDRPAPFPGITPAYTSHKAHIAAHLSATPINLIALSPELSTPRPLKLNRRQNLLECELCGAL